MDKSESKKEKDEIRGRWIFMIMYPFTPYFIFLVMKWIAPHDVSFGGIIGTSIGIVTSNILLNDFRDNTLNIRNVALRLLTGLVIGGAIVVGITMAAYFLLEDLPVMVSVVILGVVIFIVAAIRLYRYKYILKRKQIEK